MAERAGTRFVVAVLLTGVLAGCVGAVLTEVLRLIQTVAFGPHTGTFLQGVEHAPAWRRVAGPLAVGLLVGAGWWAMRRRGPVVGVRMALTDPAVRLPLRRTLLDGLLQVLAVGGGASVGREGAPRQVAAGLGAWAGERLGLPAPDRRLLVASAAGAGLAAVYNVPLSGVVFAVQALGWAVGPVEVVTASIVSLVATGVAWPVVGSGTAYVLPRVEVGWDLAVWAVVAAPLGTALAVALNVLARPAMAHQPRPDARLPATVGGAMAVVGVAAIWLPSLPGNGKGIVQQALEGDGSWPTYLALLVLKIVLTALCLRAGVVGGLLTPAVAIGAALGGGVALALASVGTHADPAAYAVVAASAVLSVSHRSALFGAVFCWELTHAPWPVVAASVVAALLAKVAARAAGRW